MSSFFGINLASGALRSFQRAMDVTGHNLANVNTPGYSRQTIDFQSNGDYSFWDHGMNSLGQGVTTGQVQRIRDAYLEQSQNRNASDLARADTTSKGLARIDDIYGEPGTSGLSTSIDKFFNAWSGLSSDPSSAAARTAVKSAAQTLTDGVRSRFSDLDQLANQSTQEAHSTIDQVNSLAQQIAQINSKIVESGNQGSPNDLLDQRDKAVNQLAQLVDVRVAKLSNGAVNVSAGGFSLVNETLSHDLPNQFDPATSSITDGTTSFSIRGGALAGQFATIQAARNQQGQLDKLADALRDQVNTLHATGKNANGDTGVLFFNDGTPSKGAINFDLSDAVKGDVRNIMTGTSGKASDAGLAQNLADLRHASVDSLGKQSISDFYKGNLTALAGDASYQAGLATTYGNISTQIQGQIASVSGVSVDEEMVNMTKLQRSYQANAKMLTVFDEVLQQTIDMVRP